MRTAAPQSILAALLVPLVFAPEFSGVTAEAGTKIEKTFTNNLRLELNDITVTIDGEEQTVPDENRPEIVISDDEEIVFTDEYVKVDGGRGVEITRTYSTLVDISDQTITPPGSEEMSITEEGESLLLDRAVTFKWNEDEGTYDAEFADDGDDDAELLADLEGDADFIYLLSDEEMAVGDSWDIELLAFDWISSPSGDLKIDAPDEDQEQDGQFTEAFRDNLDGELKGTLESIEDGVAKIIFTGDITTVFDVSQETEEGESSQEFDFTFEIEGELLWDVEAGVAKEFKFGGDVEMSIQREYEVQGTEIGELQSFEGTYMSTASFE